MHGQVDLYIRKSDQKPFAIKMIDLKNLQK